MNHEEAKVVLDMEYSHTGNIDDKKRNENSKQDRLRGRQGKEC